MTAWTLTWLLLAGLSGAPDWQSQLHEGDLIFQQSRSSQAVAVAAATHSPYTHVGVLYRDNGRWQVYEAAGPVGTRPLDRWLAAGVGRHALVLRWKDAARRLDASGLAQLRQAGKRYARKPYDVLFQWSDQRIYCSELAWKMYRDAFGVELAKVERWKDLDMDAPAVRALLTRRLPGGKFNADEPIVSPAALLRSPQLEQVVSVGEAPANR